MRDVKRFAFNRFLGERGHPIGDPVSLEFEIRFYMRDNDMQAHNVDNSLKDIMDILSGFYCWIKAPGGSHTNRSKDRQI